MTTLTSDVKIDGFPLSNMFSSSSLVVTLPAKIINGRQWLSSNEPSSIWFIIKTTRGNENKGLDSWHACFDNCLHSASSWYLKYYIYINIILMGKMHNKPSCCVNLIIRSIYMIIQSTHALTEQLCKCVKTLYGVVSLLSMMHKPPSIIQL